MYRGDYMVEVQDLVGIPFKNGGRDSKGYDCWGLVMKVYRRMGIELPDYPIDAMNTEEISGEFLSNRSNWVKIAEPTEGCLVVMRVSCDRWANHVGVCLNDKTFIHAYANADVCIDRLRRWKGSTVVFYLPGWLNDRLNKN